MFGAYMIFFMKWMLGEAGIVKYIALTVVLSTFACFAVWTELIKSS